MIESPPRKGRTKTVPELLQAGSRQSPQRVTALRLYDTGTEYELSPTRKTARASVDRILGWRIARVAMCHGAPVEIDGAGLAPRTRRVYGEPVPLPTGA